MTTSLESPDFALAETPNPLARACAKCEKVFKIADKVAIEAGTENRFHFACLGNRKPIFVGVHQEKDDKVSSVDRVRLASRLKKIKRQAKKSGQKAKIRRF